MVSSWRFGETRRSDPLPGGDSPFWMLADGTVLYAHWADVPCGEHADVVVRGTAAALAIDARARKAVFAGGCDDSLVGFTLRLELRAAARTASLAYRDRDGRRHGASWPTPAGASDPG